MENKVSIVLYSERYREAHKAFAKKMWPTKMRRREETYLRWKFRGPAQGEVEGLLLAVMGEAVVGQVGAIPVEMHAGGSTFPAQWFCDLMGDPDAQGKWIGVKLLRTAQSRDRVSLSSNPSPAAGAVLKRTRMGNTLIGPRMMLLPVKLKHVLGWKVPPKLKFLIPFLAQIGRPLMAWRSRALRGPSRGEAIRRCTWQDLAPLIEQRQKLLTCPFTIHDRDFLSWRCAGLPGFAAKLYALATDSGSYALVEEGGTYLYVMDWFASGREDFIILFQEILRLSVATGSQTIQALAQDDQETAMLQEVGFLAMRHRVQINYYTPEKTFTPAGDRFYYCWYDCDGNL